MNNIREASILKQENYRPVGVIATIKFFDAKPPSHGEIFTFEDTYYKITGVVVSSSSKLLNDNWRKGIYDCRIEEIDYKNDC